MTWQRRRAAWTTLALVAPFTIIAFILLDANVLGWTREARGLAAGASAFFAIMTFTNPGHKWRGDE